MHKYSVLRIQWLFIFKIWWHRFTSILFPPILQLSLHISDWIRQCQWPHALPNFSCYFSLVIWKAVIPLYLIPWPTPNLTNTSRCISHFIFQPAVGVKALTPKTPGRRSAVWQCCVCPSVGIGGPGFLGVRPHSFRCPFLNDKYRLPPTAGRESYPSHSGAEGPC
jgi:hypothetical protein